MKERKTDMPVYVRTLSGLDVEISCEQAAQAGRAASYREFTEIVDNIVEELRGVYVEARKDGDDHDWASRSTEDQIHEHIDSALTYTRTHFLVLKETRHDDAWKDAGVELGDEPIATMAYYALEAEVRQSPDFDIDAWGLEWDEENIKDES